MKNLLKPLLALLALSLLPVCTPSSRYSGYTGSAGQANLPMKGPSSPAWKALDHLAEANFEFSQERQAAEKVAPASIDLNQGWSKLTEQGSLTLFKHELPFEIPARRYRAPPSGLRLSLNGRDVPYVADIDRESLGREGWVVVDDGIYLATRSDPAQEHFYLIRALSQNQASRFSFADSGMGPSEFARLDVTIEEETRPCLFLPAPASATFSVIIPEKARLRFATALRAPFDAASKPSDGVRFELWVNERRVWDAERDPEDDFTNTEIDLSAWTGQAVKLRFTTLPGEDSANDLALFAAPILSSDDPTAARRVVIIGMDTLRADHTGVQGYTRDTTPELDAFARDAWVFDSAWAPAPRTMPSFRTAFTGRYPLPALNGTTTGQVLSREGIVTAGLAANIHLVPRFGFNDGFDYWHYENGAKADDQVDRAIDWLKSNVDLDSLLFIHMMDPHIFYDAPGRYKNLYVDTKPRKELPSFFTRWEVTRLQKSNLLGDAEKRYIEARYDGEVRYMSHELGRLMEHLDALPGRTLVIFHSDHGDEFWEHNGFEHNHTLYQELLRVVLWIRPPGGFAGGPHRVPETVGLIDIAPTLYDMFGIPKDRWPVMDGSSLLPLLNDPSEDTRAQVSKELQERPVHSGYLMYDTERWTVVQGTGKYTLQTMSGDEELYDLASDPGEKKNIAEESKAELIQWRQRLAKATGWPVGRGWRVQLRTGPSGDMKLSFPKPIRDAGIINPEAGLKNRANLEWGEKPKINPEDVALIEVAQDRLSLRIIPSENKPGSMYVLFGDEAPETCTIEAAGRVEEMPLSGGVFRQGSRFLEFVPGVLIVPQDTLGAELQALAADEGAMSALKALGYVE